MSIFAEKEVKLLFAGDLAILDELAENPFANAYELKALFKEYDYRIVNFEAPIIDSSCLPINKIGPTLYQKKGWNYFFSEEAFNVASLANNHIMDYGKEGLLKTLAELQKLNILTVGASTNSQSIYEPLVLRKNGISIAIFSANESTFGVFEDGISSYGVTSLGSPKLKDAIKFYRKQVDFIILFSHCGLEMINFPLPEWRQIFKQLMEVGVDIIINSHPHVIQGKEMAYQKPIYYSLGNFFFNQGGKDERWYSSLLVGVTLSQDGELNTTEYFIEFSGQGMEFTKKDTTYQHFQQNSILLQQENEEQYCELVNATCVDYWHKHFRRYFAFQPFKEKHYKLPIFLQKMINAWRYLFYTQEYFTKQNDLWLYHNICIQSNLFTIDRALKLIVNSTVFPK